MRTFRLPLVGIVRVETLDSAVRRERETAHVAIDYNGRAWWALALGSWRFGSSVSLTVQGKSEAAYERLCDAVHHHAPGATVRYHHTANAYDRLREVEGTSLRKLERAS